MTQNPNQFIQSQEKGQVDLQFNVNSLSVQIDTSEAATLVAGQGVKLVDSAGGIPKVVKVALDTDQVQGIISYNRKKAGMVAFDTVEIVMAGTVIVMEAGAAIARGGKVMPVVAGSKVVTATIGKRTIGYALDKAAVDGDLIRVYLEQTSVTL